MAYDKNVPIHVEVNVRALKKNELFVSECEAGSGNPNILKWIFCKYVGPKELNGIFL